METYRFIKSGRDWYIDLPEFIEQGGSMVDLQMVDGADTMLDLMAKNKQEITLTVSRVPFPKADVLTLIEKCDPEIGGAYYLMRHYKGQEINQTMWLCQVTAFVFGDLPDTIYVERNNATLL